MNPIIRVQLVGSFEAEDETAISLEGAKSPLSVNDETTLSGAGVGVRRSIDGDELFWACKSTGVEESRGPV